MNMVRKVYTVCILRKCDNIAVRRENECLVLKNIDFKSIYEFVRVGCARFVFYELCDPFQLSVKISIALVSGLLFPMRSDTIFGYLMHLPSPYLYLKRNTVATDDRCMKRAIHIRLRDRDVVFEASRH